MARVKRSEMRWIDEAFIGAGYVLDFSDRTYSEWFEEELGVDIDADRYRIRGNSKGNRLRCFVETEEPDLVARALRALWQYRRAMSFAREQEPQQAELIRTELFTLIERLEEQAPAMAVDAIEAFATGETLAELVQAIGRDAEAGKPGAALDRLHTYCMKKFWHLLQTRGVSVDTIEPLHSRVGKYVKVLEAERSLRPITKQILKNCIGIFQSYNDVRNNASFAHDNELVTADEARFIFDTVVSMLRFVRTVEADRFEPLSARAA